MMPKPKKQPKRRNRLNSIGDLVGGVLDPVLRKRGFASKEILENWRTIAPRPFGDETIPEKLVWSRGEGRAAGTLYLRATPAQKLAVSHDGATIAGAVNRYFGYVLVDTVRLSAEPFRPHSPKTKHVEPQPNTKAKEEVDAQTAHITDEGLQASLRKIGYGVAGPKKQ